MPLTNYTSDMPINRIFEGIQKMLISHGAKQIIFDYGSAGEITEIKFLIPSPQGILPIKLPARTDKVSRVLEKQGVRVKDGQAYRVGWKNIHDWIKAQLALLDTEMVKMEEIFLPYILQRGGQTHFEKLESEQKLLPTSEEGTVL